MNIAVVYILISVIGAAGGQVLLKKGMGSMGPLTLSLDQLGNVVWKILSNPFVAVGLMIYVGATLFWLIALSRLDLSFVYPFASLSYFLVIFASWKIFNEDISPLRITGTLIIVLGVWIISRS